MCNRCCITSCTKFHVQSLKHCILYKVSCAIFVALYLVRGMVCSRVAGNKPVFSICRKHMFVFGLNFINFHNKFIEICHCCAAKVITRVVSPSYVFTLHHPTCFKLKTDKDVNITPKFWFEWLFISPCEMQVILRLGKKSDTKSSSYTSPSGILQTPSSIGDSDIPS